MNRLEKIAGCMEIERTIKDEVDIVDTLKVVEDNGVMCLIGDDFMNYQENHE